VWPPTLMTISRLTPQNPVEIDPATESAQTCALLRLTDRVMTVHS